VTSTASNRRILRPLLVRAASLLALWLVIAGTEPAEIIVGALTAAAATAASLQLSPPGHTRVSPIAAVTLLLHLLYRALGAGLDVAWRALDPRLPLRPGFVTFSPRLSTRPQCDAFCTMASLLPGTLPAGFTSEGSVLIHCLDATEPVIGELSHEEAAFAQAFGG
jgi:multicomponent Na+:H+ antiporter subunit E